MGDPLGALMGGGGGPGPMGPPPAGGPGGPPGGGMGGPDDVLKMLATLQQAPSPSAEEQMIFQATLMLNGAYAKVAVRNPEVGKLIMDANSKANQALQKMKGEGARSMGQPPDLGAPGPVGAPPLPGANMPGM